MQRVSIVGKKGDSVCSKAIKGIAKGEACMPCKGKSTEKKVKKDRREGDSSTHGQAIESIARMKEEFGRRIEEESRGTLWQRSARGSMPTRVRVVHRGSNSNVCAV